MDANISKSQASIAIRDWPDSEKPREKLLNNGSQSLSDAELLAIFLRTGVAGKTALDLAREGLLYAGGLRSFLNMFYEVIYNSTI